jgi:hypothetical protein
MEEILNTLDQERKYIKREEYRYLMYEINLDINVSIIHREMEIQLLEASVGSF